MAPSIGCLVAVLGACSSPPQPEPVAPPPPVVMLEPPPEPPQAGFAGGRAFGHVRALFAIGPRVAGTDGAATARAYVREQLEAHGLSVTAQEGRFQDTDGNERVLANVEVVLPAGPSAVGSALRGEFVLAAPLDTVPSDPPLLGANESASGAAVLLEAARALLDEPLPYPVRLLFLDGEALDAKRSIGSELALEHLEQPTVRLLVYLHQVGDADLEIRRDLSSHRVFRDIFFRAALDMGHGDAFPMEVGFDQVPAGHRVFFKRGLRRVVALSDIRYGGPDPPGPLWRTAGDNLDHVSQYSLETVGRVLLAGLRKTATLLERVDAHVAGVPLADSVGASGATSEDANPAPVTAAETKDPTPTGMPDGTPDAQTPQP